MQYEIGLPADYDMDIIRKRVATRGHLLDKFPGLGMKLYLIRERGIDNSPVNQYAPFYLWASVAGMNSFLWGGGGFAGICRDFGRPPVHHWTGVACTAGAAADATPVAATRRIEPMPEGDPESLVAAALSEHEQRAALPGVHSAACAVDPVRWSLLHMTVWSTPPTASDDIRYQILHASRPQFGDISTGRSW